MGIEDMKLIACPFSFKFFLITIGVIILDSINSDFGVTRTNTLMRNGNRATYGLINICGRPNAPMHATHTYVYSTRRLLRVTSLTAELNRKNIDFEKLACLATWGRIFEYEETACNDAGTEILKLQLR